MACGSLFMAQPADEALSAPSWHTAPIDTNDTSAPRSVIVIRHRTAERRFSAAEKRLFLFHGALVASWRGNTRVNISRVDSLRT